MAVAKVRVTVDLTEAENRRVEEFMEKHRIRTKTGLFRDAIDEYMNRRERENEQKKRDRGDK